MPKKIDPKVKERCLQQMLVHAAEYPNPTEAAAVVAKRIGVGAKTPGFRSSWTFGGLVGPDS